MATESTLSHPTDWFRLALRLILTVLTVFLLLAALTGFGISMLQHAITPDFPWLLQTGNFIMQHHTLPQTDIFSWTQPHRHWVMYQWLFELILAWAHHAFGFQGLVRIFILDSVGLYVLLPLLLGQQQKTPMALTILVSSMALLLLPINYSLRPMAVTALFLGLQYGTVAQYRLGKWSLKWVCIVIAVIYALWGNMHTGVMLGLWSLGLMIMGDQLTRWGVYRFTPAVATAEGQAVSLKSYGWMGLTAFLASLCNPYGIFIYGYLSTLSQDRYLNSVIIELQSPNFHMTIYVFFLILLGSLMMLMPRCRKVFSAQEFLHLFVFTMLTFFVLRMVVWTALFYALILPKALQHCSAALSPDDFFREYLEGFQRFRPVVIAVLGLCCVLFLVMPSWFPIAQHGKCLDLRPGIEAYNRLKRANDVLLNDAEIGSCILLWPNPPKVFIDTRFDFYTGRFLSEQSDVMYRAADWQAYFKKWHINTVVMKSDKPLVRILQYSPKYQTLYEDKTLAILRQR